MENYELVTNIGKGSSGAVFLAKSLKTKKLVAIKKIEIDENRRSRCKKSVVREASILRRLVHPHIVECEEWFLDDEDQTMHIVLEYCNGGTMQDMVKQAGIKNTYFSENKVLKWMAEIVSAVSYMHSKRILHRDLKTENVFIVKPDTAKLGDFGISKEIDHTLDLAQTCVGTPCYLSPELCQDIPYNSKSDVWALGCLLFEMAALKPAFDAANLVSLFYKIVKGDFTALPKHCSTVMHELVALILQKDPEKRPTAAKLLQHKALAPFAEKIVHDSKNFDERSSNRSFGVKESSLDKIKPISRSENRSTITNDDAERTMSPGPSYAYNMFLSGLNSQPKPNESQQTTKLTPQRANSVLGTNLNGGGQSSGIPKLFDYEASRSPRVESPPPQEVETARPQTCPHSASRTRTSHIVEEEANFNDTVVTWSGYGDRGSRHRSGRRRCDSISLSSGTDESSDSDIETEGRKLKRAGTRYKNEDEYSNSSSSFDEESDYDDDFIQDEHNDDDIPECIENDNGDEMSGDSSHNYTGDEIMGNGDHNNRTLPGSAWLRSKKTKVLQQHELSGTNSKNVNHNNNNTKKKKARLPGSSWLSEKQRSERNKMNQESSSDDAIVLGENNHNSDKDVDKKKESKRRHHRRSGKIRNLPGSAWLKNDNSKKQSETKIDKLSPKEQHKPSEVRREYSMVLESCGSANDHSSPEKKQSDQDVGNMSDEYAYSDDFDYEDDFELSDDDMRLTTTKTEDFKSSLDVVRQGCIELLGEKVFDELSTLFNRGLTLNEAVNKFNTKKVDREALEACFVLLQKK